MLKKKKVLLTSGAHDINSKVELTLLDPRSSNKDVENLCNIAYKNRYVGVAVFPNKVKIARQHIDRKLDSALKVISVIDFPFGESSLQAKLASIKKSIADGADELDVCVGSSLVFAEDYNGLKKEVSRMVRISRGKVFKAVIEASYFNRDQIIRLTKTLSRAKVDFIMTNTGYGEGGATPEICELIKNSIRGNCAVKASGGITNKAIATDLCRVGTERIGTSRVI